MIRLENIHKSFGKLHVLKGINLTVEKGEVVCIIGPSGSGKSTLLRCINHLERITSGKIVVDGEVMDERKNNADITKIPHKKVLKLCSEVGMVFQRFNLFPHLTALGNVMEAPVTVLKVPKEQAEKEARELLISVGLGDKIDDYPSRLSGGQQQRVAIARAIVGEPRLILADEPTGNLHSAQGREIMELFKRLNAEGTTIVQVTHSEVNASYSDRIVHLRDGWVVQEDGTVGVA